MDESMKMIAQQKADQAWAYIRQWYKDIERIADNGPQEEDKEIVQKMAKLIRGEITMRILDSECE